MVDIVTAATAAYSAAKTAVEALGAVKDGSLKLQIAELLSSLADLKIAAAESREEIQELRRLLDVKESMVFESSVYVVYDNFLGDVSGVYCPKCYDVEGLQVRLRSTATRKPHCPNCEMHWDSLPFDLS